MAIETSASALQHIKAGKVRALAVSTATRAAALPDVPTLAEAGLKGYEVTTWYGLLAPKGTPKEVIAKLRAAMVEALADPTVQKRFADVGQGIWPRDKQTPEALAAHQQAEIGKWWPIIKAAGIKAE
jgi:tripartite-type tricarboxylate transporter receptor subunit TctC